MNRPLSLDWLFVLLVGSAAGAGCSDQAATVLVEPAPADTNDDTNDDMGGDPPDQTTLEVEPSADLVEPDEGATDPVVDLCDFPANIQEAEPCASTPALLSPGVRPDHVAFAATASGALLTYSTETSIELRWVDEAGQVYQSDQLPVAPGLSGLAAAPSDEAMFVFYSMGLLDEDGPDGTGLYMVEVDPAGSHGEPVLLQTNFELRPGAIATGIGPRVWGIA
ncbi:MAG: hypothetical protein ACI9WU_000747 [Myxococcota bacterium]|jgi:hypothetical protein